MFFFFFSKKKIYLFTGSVSYVGDSDRRPKLADFSYAQPITDGHNLVAISYRMGGKKLLWDAKAVQITNLPEANKYLTREYRKGWEPGTV